ncbi:MAG: GLPGLI family protein [Saprospiraceae bacterium]|nr:GLPGLI family protein [Saprospiraceae bacterium]
MRRTFLFILFIAASSCATFAQSSGEIEYEFTRQVSANQMARFGGGDESGAPSVITRNQTMRFSGNMGTWTQPRPGREIAAMIGGAGQMQQMRRFMPFESKDYVDFNKSTLLHYMRATSGDDTTTWYLNVEPFAQPADWKVEKKTKKILGYECQKATATLRDIPYTVWYTTDIPGINFSPINGLAPAKGLVLALESDEQSFVAKKVDLAAAIAPEEVKPDIADAKEVSAEELRDMRRQAGERMRTQFQQMQRQ